MRQADIVLTNFKPGVIAVARPRLRVAEGRQPGIVVVDSSAFGPTGPWSRRLGYGPLVRAAAGFTEQWVYPGEPGSFSDAVTVYPDHVCARIGAMGALALLIRRERTRAGGSVSVAQSEVMLSHFSARIAAPGACCSARAHRVDPQAREHDAPWGLFPCAGDDDWVAVTVRGDADWAAWAAVIERPDLLADPALATAPAATPRGPHRRRGRGVDPRSPRSEAMETLQAGGRARRRDAARDRPAALGATTGAPRLPRGDGTPTWTEPSFYENAQVARADPGPPDAAGARSLGADPQIAAELLGLDAATKSRTLIAALGALEVAPVGAGSSVASAPASLRKKIDA